MRRFSVIFAAVLLAAFACGFMKAPRRAAAVSAEVLPPHADSSERSIYLYTEGLKRLAIYGDTLGALNRFAEAAAADSACGPAWYGLARIAEETGDRAAGIRFAERAYRRDTTQKRYLEMYVRSLILAQRYGEALPLQERLLEADRSNADSYRVLALLYDIADRPFSAIAILDSADGQFGSIPYLSAMKRQLLLKTRQYDKALDEARRAAEARPYDPENHIALGEIYGIKGDDSLAQASFRRAIAADSTSVAAWAALGDYYLARGNYIANLEVTQHLFEMEEVSLDQKVDMFNRLTANRQFYREYLPQINRMAATLSIKYPDEKSVVTLYTDHLIKVGEAERALEIYRSHLGDEPPQLDYYTMAAALESWLGRPDSAALLLDRAVERFPDNAEIYIRRGGFYQNDGDNRRAVECFNRALKLAETDEMRSSIWGYIGDAYHAEGDRRRCYSVYEKALKYDPDNAAVLNNYAYFLSLEGRSLDRALSMSERATALTPNNATYIDTRAWVLYRLGRYDEAKAQMRTALSLDTTNSPELRMHYGDILAALGDNYMAEVYWRRALEYGYTDTEAVEARIGALKQNRK